MEQINDSVNETDKELIDGCEKIVDERSAWVVQMENNRRDLLDLLSERHHKMIKKYYDSELGYQDEGHVSEDTLTNGIEDGRISLAFENLVVFPSCLVDILRFDVSHLDLSMNDIRDFDFLRGFESLKTLIIDGNPNMDPETLPLIPSLEIFYVNKCEIEFPRSFVFRISVLFPNLRHFSMMDNPVVAADDSTCDEAWLGREHRIRMLAIFINPKLIHFNDKEITETERQHSIDYHNYLGPIDRELTKFKASVDTDDILKILPDYIRDKALELLELDAQELSDDSDEGLADVKISAYFASQDDNDVSIASFFDNKSPKTRAMR